MTIIFLHRMLRNAGLWLMICFFYFMKGFSSEKRWFVIDANMIWNEFDLPGFQHDSILDRLNIYE